MAAITIHIPLKYSPVLIQFDHVASNYFWEWIVLTILEFSLAFNTKVGFWRLKLPFSRTRTMTYRWFQWNWTPHSAFVFGIKVCGFIYGFRACASLNISTFMKLWIKNYELQNCSWGIPMVIDHGLKNNSLGSRKFWRPISISHPILDLFRMGLDKKMSGGLIDRRH